MRNIDEPALGSEQGTLANPPTGIKERILHLLEQQPYAVLCTQGGGQPYGSLVAFAASSDLISAVFATPITTRKYRLLSECDRVALCVDNRAQHLDDISRIEAITATGRALQLDDGGPFEASANLLSAKHPYLEAFIRAETTALFRVDIVRYLHVTRFQEVQEWVPPSPG